MTGGPQCDGRRRRRLVAPRWPLWGRLFLAARDSKLKPRPSSSTRTSSAPNNSFPIHQPHRPYDMLEVSVTSEARAALAADLAMRFLLKVKYSDRDSRHSKVAIAWAESRTDQLTRAMLEQMGQETAGFTIQLNIVELIPRYALVCYDVYLQGCDKDLRSEIDKSLERPVYMITRRAKVFYVRRSDKMVESRLASRWRHTGERDKGPRPFFVDLENPPIYDGGVRLERPEGYDSERGPVR